MRTHTLGTVPLGDVVAAAFDAAARHTSDPREVARLAAWVVSQMLRRTQIVGALPVGTA